MIIPSFPFWLVLQHGRCQNTMCMQALLAEYLTNGDTLEASRCLMELNVPYYHHELVKRALVMAADDSKDHDSPLLLKLLSELASSGAINQVSLSVCVSVGCLLDCLLECLPIRLYMSVHAYLSD